MSTDTIAAIATPPGRGGVAIIRLSGPQAYTISLKLNGNKQLPPRLATYCSFYKNETELLDQGLMIYFKAPHSFTGEDVVEVHAHGSPVVLDMLLRLCVALGARLAKPGEFSERAFLNDKIDLAQAEAIADLIQASSQKAALMATRTLQGEFSNKINHLNEQIIYLRLYVEAAIDFPEEEIDFLNDGKVTRLLHALLEELESIRKQANQGVLLREGLSIVIAGKPNAGKSTLINYLAGREVAIVTEVAGTTRDVMREHIVLEDIPLHIIDTAGLRDSDDLVEQEGIKRAWKEIKQADCILLVVDVNAPQDSVDLIKELQKNLPTEIPIIVVFNKMDTLDALDHTSFSSSFYSSTVCSLDSEQPLDKSTQMTQHTVYISAKSGSGMEHLKNIIKSIAGYQPNEGHFLARRRHLQALEAAKKLLVNGQEQLVLHRAGELLAEDLRLAHQALSEITGAFTSDDLLGKIFSSFCIGK